MFHVISRHMYVRSMVVHLVVLCSLGSVARADEKTIRIESREATPVTMLVDSMGVNTHFVYADSPYVKRYLEVRTKLKELGLRHVRDILNPHINELAQMGIATTVLADRNGDMTPDAYRVRVKGLNSGGQAVDAVEGPNEPDGFWKRLNYSWNRQGYPEGPAAWQRDLFRVFKSDAATAKLTVIGPSLGLAGMPDAPPPVSWKGLGAYADWGNFHPYPFNGNPFGPEIAYGTLRSFFHNGTFPSVGLDEAPDFYRAYREIYGSMPMAATETGYPTARNYSSDELQAKYVVRAYLENFRLGIKRTYLYQLLDNLPDPRGTDADLSFGLLRYDLSERPSFRAVKALTQTLNQPGLSTGALPGELHFFLRVIGKGDFPDPSRVHHLILRRLDGSLLLLLWHEVSGEDASSQPRRPITVPPLIGLLEASSPVHMQAFDLQAGAQARVPSAPPIDRLGVDITDGLVAISIAR